MIGQTLGHYRIVEQLGAGGMGVVYRARDERLERDVAVKVLPAGSLGDESARARFRREALALARLTHPNIAHVYDFDSQGGTDFLAMEYVPGQTLTQKLAPGPLLEKEILALAEQIAAALEEAHEHGIVHRDLKPANIALTPKGQAKVLDFGLAKLLRPGVGGDVTQTLTEPHAVAGTLPYMAPEQLQGEAADARVDIYALGCVLYEMAAGRRPFTGDTAPSLTDAILHTPPVSLRAVNPRISPELERIILKCLEKDAENRYQSAKELRVDLRRCAQPSTSAVLPVAASAGSRSMPLAVYAGIAVVLLAAAALALDVGGIRNRLFHPAATGEIRSLAVLPLENLSRDPEQEYFADGMTEALITEIGQIHSLRVISRTSIMRYKGERKPLPQIARELGVDAILEGAVQRSGERVGINVQLIRAQSERQLWAKPYDREMRDVLSLQREVARAVVQEVRAQLTPQEEKHLGQPAPLNAEAHEAYLKGRFVLQKGSREAIQQAIDYFQQALAKDPNYARAYVGIADAYVAGRSIYFAPHEVMPKAKTAVLRAVQLDDNLAEAHSTLGAIRMYYDYDWPAAVSELKRAMALNPSLAEARDNYALYLAAFDRRTEAAAEVRLARQLDPLSPMIMADAGWIFYLARDYDEAMRQCQQAVEIAPDAWYAYAELGLAYEKKGRFPDAFAALEKARSLDSNSMILEMLGGAYASAGKPEEARRVLAELTERAKKSYICPYEVATVFAGLGDKKSALEWLERSYDERADCTPWAGADSKLDSLRSDPKFQDLLHRIGFPQ